MVVVPMLISLLLQSPRIQTYVVKQTASFISKRIGTDISIEKVDIGKFYNIKLNNIFVASSMGGDTLVYVDRLTTRLTPIKTINDDLSLDFLRIEGGEFNLYTNTDSLTNIKELMSRIKRDKEKESSKPFILHSKDVKITDFVFTLSRDNHEQVSYGVNYQDMEMRDINIHLVGFSMAGDSLTSKIDNISFKEKGGVVLDKFSSTKATLSANGMRFFDGEVILNSSTFLEYNMASLDYYDWEMYDFLNRIPLSAEIKSSRIEMATVALFTKEERKWSSVFEISGNFYGSVMNVEGQIFEATTSNCSIKDTKFQIFDIVDPENTIFDISVGDLKASAESAVTIMNDFAKEPIELPKKLVATREVNFSGAILGTMRNFDAQSVINMTDCVGEVKTNLNVQSAETGIEVDGSLIVNEIDIQDIYREDKFNEVTFDIYINGNLSRIQSDIKIDGSVTTFGYNNYVYNGIVLNGAFDNNSFTGFLSSDDPNLDFEFNGMLDLSNDVPFYNFSVNLKNADLTALNLNKRDSVSLLSGYLTANGSGMDIDNLNASIIVSRFDYTDNIYTTSSTTPMNIVALNSETNKSLTLESEFFDLTFKAAHSYDEMFDFFKKSTAHYLPSLVSYDDFKNKEIAKSNSRESRSVEDFYVIILDVKEANNLATIFVPTLNVAKGSKLSFLFNPSEDSFSLNMNSDKISFNNSTISKISVNSQNVGEKINLYARADEFLTGNIYIPNLSVIAEIENDNIKGDFGFNNPDDGSYATIRTKTTLQPYKEGLRYIVNALPSNLSIYEDIWESKSGVFIISPDKIEIQNYSLVSNNQTLSIDGTISENLSDTLKIDMKEFSIKPVNIFTSRIGYDINSSITGKIDAAGLLNETEKYLNLDLLLDNNNINNINLPSAALYTVGGTEKNRVNLILESQDKTIINGFYNVKNQNYQAAVRIPNFDVALAAHYLDGIADKIAGEAEVDIIMSNSNGYFEINGSVDMPSIEANIIATNTYYYVKGKALINDNQFTLINGSIRDIENGEGVLTGSLTNEKFKKVKYNIDITTQDLLALNTTEKENPTFYGKVYARGDVSINGDRNNIVLSAKARPAKASTFILPLGERTLSEANFITFATKVVEKKKTALFMQKEESVNSALFTMNMDLQATPLLVSEIVMDPITGSSLKATGNGNIKIDIEPKNESFSIIGNYILDEGVYRFILPNFTVVDKIFNIKAGSWMRWTGDPLDATLNVDAIYPVKASLAPLLGDQMVNKVSVDCVLNLGGNLLSPDITLGIEAPNLQVEEQSAIKNALTTQEEISTQIFYLLLSNSFYPTNSSVSASSIEQMGKTTGIEFLTNQINNILSSDKFNFGINYMPHSDLTSNEFGFDFSAPIVGNKLYIDVAGNYDFMDNTNAVTTADQSNWSGDVYLTWVLNSAGNLSLKAFTKTLDSFDENQGLQDNGAGVYFKADFDSKEDLKLRLREYLIRRRETKEGRKSKKNKK